MTHVLFEDSAVEMAYGTNEAAGREFGAHRWAARVLIMAQLGRASAATSSKPTPGKLASSASSPVHVFLELNVDTDGSLGPDVLMARTGITLDAGRILSGMLGAI